VRAAFVEEEEIKHFKDIAPNPGAILFFLRVENNGTIIRDEKSLSAQNMDATFLNERRLGLCTG
jgi:hypothetical protein